MTSLGDKVRVKPHDNGLMRNIAQAILNVAARPPELRGPWLFDEETLQAQAVIARKFLAETDSLDLSPPVVEEGLSLPRVDGKIAPPVEIGYTNYRGEFAVRCIVPVSFWYGSTDWHPEPQWLVKAWDADKGAERDFAFKDFSPPASPSKPEEPAPVTVPEPQAVAWRIDTDDQVELLAKECGINNRRYMTPKDYSIWCEQQRQFARLAAATISGGGKVEVTDEAVEIAARAFDPFPFESWQRSYDYEMSQSGDAAEAKSFADWSIGKRVEEVRSGARAALTAALATMGGKQP